MKSKTSEHGSLPPARRWLWENSLSLVLVSLFLSLWILQSIAGHLAYNDDRRDHGEPEIGYGAYLTTGHFLEATSENWESEFLQMGFYVLLTIFLRQKGSAESKKPYGQERVDEDPRHVRHREDVPGPVRRGGWLLLLYENSLTGVLFLLFFVSFALHAVYGAVEYSEEQLAHGGLPVSTADYVISPRFWFESFQNWQSEFLAVLAIVVLSIFLRQRGSPESKPVAAPHHETGGG